MVLGASWGSLGLLLGALGGLLGDLWGLQIDPKGVTRFGFLALWALFGLFWSLLVAEDGLESVLGPSWAPFWWSRGLLGGILVPVGPILSSKTDLPSFDNLILSSSSYFSSPSSSSSSSFFFFIFFPCPLNRPGGMREAIE